jgi:excisionase family DNA binding protein
MSDSSRQPAGEPKLGGRCGPSKGKVLSQPRANNAGSNRTQGKQSTVRPRLLIIQHAADYVGVSHWTIRRWLDRGILAALRLGNSRGPGRPIDSGRMGISKQRASAVKQQALTKLRKVLGNRVR